MGLHNVVIAVTLEAGNNKAVTVATELLNDQVRLVGGNQGSIPSEDEDDIQLRDIAASKPTETFGGVVQFDRGKIHSNGGLEWTGTLEKPPLIL